MEESTSADLKESCFSHISILNNSVIKEENFEVEVKNVKSEFAEYQDEACTSSSISETVVAAVPSSSKSIQSTIKKVKTEVIEPVPECFDKINQPPLKKIRLMPNIVPSSSFSNQVYSLKSIKNPPQFIPPRKSYIPSSVNAMTADKYETISTRGGICPIIFCTPDKQFCYGFTPPMESTCTCLGCNELIENYAAKFGNAKPATISMIKNIQGVINISLKNVAHICKPKKYLEMRSVVQKIVRPQVSLPFRIVTPENYQIRIQLNGNKHLIIFDKFDPTKCYHYFNMNSENNFMCIGCQKKKKTISAVVCLDKNGEEYVKAKTNHICEPITYEEYKIVKITDFEICSNDAGDSQLIIFDSNDKKFCRRYSWNFLKKCYFCSPCTRASKWISAKISEGCDGEKFVEAEALSHVCSPVEYTEKIFSQNYKIIYSEKGPTKLIYFCGDGNNYFRRFSYTKSDKNFYCHGCKFLKKHVVTKIWKNVNGEEYIQASSEHICKPVLYIPG